MPPKTKQPPVQDVALDMSAFEKRIQDQINNLSDAIQRLVDMQETGEAHGKMTKLRAKQVDGAFKARQWRASRKLGFQTVEDFRREHGNIDYVPAGARPAPKQGELRLVAGEKAAPKGAKGAKGPKGAKGRMGAKGAKGPMGKPATAIEPNRPKKKAKKKAKKKR